MRSKYTTQKLLATFFCAAGLGYAGPVIAQDPGDPADQVNEVEDLFGEGDNNTGEGAVEGTDEGNFDIHVKDLDITQVLQLLSIQSERNIVASRDVSGKVSADLFGVDFYEALDMVLIPNGFRWVEEGNFIKVISQEQWEADVVANQEVVTRIVRLNYLRADEAATFVTPILSENGTIVASSNVEGGMQPSIDDAGEDSYSGQPTLVIRDYEAKVEEIVSTLEQLDVQPKQVIIEVTILSASLTEKNALGVDFALFANLDAFDFVNPLNAIDGLLDGTTPNNTQGAFTSDAGNVASGDSTLKMGFVAGDAAVFLRALDDVTDTTLIASPKVMVLDRQRADVLVGSKIAYLSTTVTETSETQTVEFLEVGTQLTVRPFIAEDGQIRMELRPSVSDATIRNIGSTTAPDEETVEMVTNVIVTSGQTIVLGGMFTDDSEISRRQVPGLGDVPLFGNAFRGQDDSIGRSEVIFMVKATVVDTDVLLELGDEAMDRVGMARVAEREQTLPWSRSRLTARHFVNARELYDEALGLEGAARDEKMAEALYCVDMALHRNPSMVDALMLKEEITGHTLSRYEESIVTQSFEAVLSEEMDEMGMQELPELPEAQAEVIEAPQAEAAPEADFQADEADATAFDTPAELEDFSDEPMSDDVLVEVETEGGEDLNWLDDVFGVDPSQPENGFDESDQYASDNESFDNFDESEVDPFWSLPADEAETEIELVDLVDFAEQDLAEAGEAESHRRSRWMGFSWRSLSTARLLELASQAAEEAEVADADQADDATVEVNPDDVYDLDFDEAYDK